MEAELLDCVDEMVRQYCHTGEQTSDYNGFSKGSFVTDSGAITAAADAMRLLAKHGRFRIVSECGRMVAGYFPENDPQRNQ